ncbi:beta-1,3-galactosyltransferase 1-like [Ylistrum balloti]|uniref:beta-1,3-galactosyltransferase 1-like n=1 Tax=Ylistrum balloti TaxID=509963 RepID=UPI002905943A|nr:beta-1,3-galactosyltransferase 1-like [Ylistrum balloti]
MTRFIQLIMLTSTLTCIAYLVQNDAKTAFRLEDGNYFLVENTTQLPFVTENMTIASNFTDIPLTPHPAIHIQLNIDLKQYVQDKIEKNIDIPAKPINEHSYGYIHRPPKCQFTNTTANITLLVLVKSSVQNVLLRTAIRNTWGSGLSGNTILRFMLGYHKAHVETTKTEDKIHHDVIVEKFVDSYPNNTLKTIMGFNWAVNECPTARVILFLDDDHLPHMGNIMAFLRSLTPDQLDSLFCGYRLDHGLVYKGKHQWALPKKIYPHTHWPPYLRGGAYLVSLKIAKRFSLAFPFVQYLHVDDGYLGIVALKLDIKPQHDYRFQMDKKMLRTNKTYFVYNDYKHTSLLRNDWGVIKNNN